LLIVAAGCSFSKVVENNPITGGELTVEKERELTSDIAAQIRQQVEFVSDPVVLAYVNEIGQEIVRVTEPQPFVYHFAVIDDEALNAFTIGGGHIYLNSGVIAQAGDVAELAGVIAHEIAHVRKRHIAQRNEGQGLATLATLAALAAAALADAGPEVLIVSQGINVALQLKNSRSAEAEADREAIDFLIEAGYDPSGMVRFFERIQLASPRPGAEIPEYLYTHPGIEERIAVSKATIKRRLPAAGSVEPDPELRGMESDSPPSASGLIRDDGRLREIQARLAALGAPVAGGSGLRTRVDFDRTLADPLLEQAEQARESDDLDRAQELLLEAREVSPDDPRVVLRLADLAEQRGDLESAVEYLEIAFEIDPTVPLVQYRLGVMHERLGNRTRAVFYLEQAAATYRPDSAGRQRAELELARMTTPFLRVSGLTARGSSKKERDSFLIGETVVWWGSIHKRFQPRNPTLRITWTGPDGDAALRETVNMSPFGGISSELPTADLPPGKWQVEVVTGDALVEARSFTLRERR
jgi:predicted Zn-dependent protease